MLPLVNILSLSLPAADVALPAPDSLAPAAISPVGNSTSNALSLLNFKSGNKILYAISTCQDYHSTRALAVHDTWCKHIESCVFYSDHETSKTPATIKIEVESGSQFDGLRRAQMRYIRILKHATDLILNDAHGLFGSTTWAVVCDDDSYIFHHNMLTYLESVDHTKAIYTGHTLKDAAYPVDDDGEGHTLPKAIHTHFACGGGGSVFSHGALKKLKSKIHTCIENSLPGGSMWEWQSDWMMGECANNAGIKLLNQPADRFGQFLYRQSKPGEVPEHLLVDDPEKIKHFCELDHGRCEKPVSIHPVKEREGAMAIFKHSPNSATKEVTKIRPELHLDGSITVK